MTNFTVFICALFNFAPNVKRVMSSQTPVAVYVVFKFNSKE